MANEQLKGVRYSDIRNKSDNLEDNLEFTMRSSHSREHNRGYRDGYQKGLIDGRTKQIAELKQEIKLLQWQLKEFTHGEVENDNRSTREGSCSI